MAEVHRLQSCRRCGHLFVATPGQRLCPDCQKAARRERARRSLWSGSSDWQPLTIFAVGTLGAGALAAGVHPGGIGIAAWVGGIVALVLVGRAP